MLPYRRYEYDQVSSNVITCYKIYIEIVSILYSDQLHASLQGNFCTCLVGKYKLVWDNSYSTFFKKVGKWLASPHDMIFS